MGRSRATRHSPSPDESSGLGFLLSQVGSHSSTRFAERLWPLGFKPVHVGILRVIRQDDGLSQQALGEKLGMFASRLVAIIDELQVRGLVERRNSPADRRSYALHLTEAGRAAMEQIGRVGREHQESLFAALDEAQRTQLADLLQRIATEQGLTPGIHPGMRKLGGDSDSTKSCEA